MSCLSAALLRCDSTGEREAEEKRKRNDAYYGRHLPLDDRDKQNTAAHLWVSYFVELADRPAKYLVHNERWNPREYMVSENTGGTPCFVLCNCNGNVWCLRPRKKPLFSKHWTGFTNKFEFEKMTSERPHPEGHMLFAAQDVVIGDRKYVILCDFHSSGLSTVPLSVTARQAAMEAFVADTGVRGVLVKTVVPIQFWRSKLQPCPFATNGLIFVPATRNRGYHTKRKLKWQPMPTVSLLVSDALKKLDESGSIVYPVYCQRAYTNAKLGPLNVGCDHPFYDDGLFSQVGTSYTPADDIFDGVGPATTICEYAFSAPLGKWVFVRHRPDKNEPSSFPTVKAVYNLTIRPLRLGTLLAGVTTYVESASAKKRRVRRDAHKACVDTVGTDAVGERISEQKLQFSNLVTGGVPRPKKRSTCLANIHRCHQLIRRWLYSAHGSKGFVVLDVGIGESVGLAYCHELGFKRVLAVNTLAKAPRIGHQRTAVTGPASVTGSTSRCNTELLAADMSLPNALWHYMLSADVCFCHCAIHHFFDGGKILAQFLHNIKQQLKPCARLVVTFLDASKVKQLALPFTVLSPDDDEVEFSIEDSTSAPGRRIRIYSRSMGALHKEYRLVNVASLSAAFLSNGFHIESIVGCGQVPSLAAKLDPDEKFLISLYACATFRPGAQPQHTIPRQPRGRHRLFLPAMVFVPYLELEEMLRFTLVCRSACELVHRRTRLSAHPRGRVCHRCTAENSLGSTRCGICKAVFTRIYILRGHREEAEANEIVPRIGNYRLPMCAQGHTFNSFLFKAFGEESMMERSWYTSHVSHGDYVFVWGGVDSSDDEGNVIEKFFHKYG